MDVRADDNCRLWTAETGRGEPLVMCHGGPGPPPGKQPPGKQQPRTGLGWDWREPFYRAISARLAPHRARIEELLAEGQDREVAIVQWSAEFGDGREREHAEEMATPWFGINQDCYPQVWAELERTWREDALVEQCRALEVPVLIIDGGRDLRPRWAVDSLARALPRVTRVVLPEAGHIPWLEEPEEFTRQLLAFLGPALHL